MRNLDIIILYDNLTNNSNDNLADNSNDNLYDDLYDN